MRERYKNVAIPEMLHMQLKIAAAMQKAKIMDVVVASLTKSIGIKPMVKINEYGHKYYACMKCGEVCEEQDYCYNCGQRIDWNQ